LLSYIFASDTVRFGTTFETIPSLKFAWWKKRKFCKQFA